MLIVAQNLHKNEDKLIEDFENLKNFCSQEKANNLRIEFDNMYAVEVLDQECKAYENDKVKQKIKSHHNSEVENILTIINSETIYSDYKIINENVDFEEENEAVIRLKCTTIMIITID